MRPHVQPRPPLPERRLLRQEPRHVPGRDQVQSQEDHQAKRWPNIYPHPGGPEHKTRKVLPRRQDEARRVRLEDELRRRVPRVRDRDQRPRTQADDTRLRRGDSSKAAGGR